MAVPCTTAILCLRANERLADDLRKDEEGYEPAPGEELERKVVPQRHKGEYEESGGYPVRIASSADGDVNVSITQRASRVVAVAVVSNCRASIKGQDS